MYEKKNYSLQWKENHIRFHYNSRNHAIFKSAVNIWISKHDEEKNVSFTYVSFDKSMIFLEGAVAMETKTKAKIAILKLYLYQFC